MITHQTLKCSLETFDAARCLLKAQRIAKELNSQKIHDLREEDQANVAKKDHSRDVDNRSEYITPSSIEVSPANIN